jgi:hypothetical protein
MAQMLTIRLGISFLGSKMIREKNHEIIAEKMKKMGQPWDIPEKAYIPPVYYSKIELTDCQSIRKKVWKNDP